MKKRTLGRTGLDVTEISLGAWQFGGKAYGAVSEEDALSALDAFLEDGGNFIDTARGYGKSERVLGDWFRTRGHREDFVIASKTPKTEPADIRADLETTLRDLGTDRVELYYLHNPPEDPEIMDRTLVCFEELKREGKILSIGASIKGPDVTDATVSLARQYIETGRVDVLMLIYSILRQKIAEVFPLCIEQNIGVVARTVMESGFLSGRYRPGQWYPPEGDHRRRWGPERVNRILQRVETIRQEYLAPPCTNVPQLALRFALDTPGVGNVVLGVRNADQIRTGIDAAELPPTDPDLRKRLARAFVHSGTDCNTGK